MNPLFIEDKRYFETLILLIYLIISLSGFAAHEFNFWSSKTFLIRIYGDLKIRPSVLKMSLSQRWWFTF